MHFCTRYWLVGACFAIFCTILMVQHFVLSDEDPPKKDIKQDELEEEIRKIRKIREDWHNRILKDIMDKTFIDGPLKGKCESNGLLLQAKDSTECLSQNTIFFLETSNSSSLNARQACAVESATLHHPEWQVRVLSTSSGPLNLTDSFMERLALYGNVRFLRMNLHFLLKGTPLGHWYKKGYWKSSPYKVVHLSDAIRLCVLWKYGGIYLDTDVVVLRSLSYLRNTVSLDNGINIGNSFLSFDRSHPLLKYTIADFLASYDPDSFAMNGPVLLNSNFKEYCKPKFDNATDNKCGINVLPKESVYPIAFNKWQEYLKPQTASLSETVFNSSYIFHLWNNLSKHGKMLVRDNSWYEMAMKRHCPKVYELVVGIGYA